MAGLAGGLLGCVCRSRVGSLDFLYFRSLTLLLVATIFGITSVSGAILGALFFVVLPEVLRHTASTGRAAGATGQALQPLIIGALAIAAARHPEGISGQVRNRLRPCGSASFPARVTSTIPRSTAPHRPRSASSTHPRRPALARDRTGGRGVASTNGSARLDPVVAADLAATPLLELRGIRASYGKIEVLHGLDLTVAGGEILAILGPNGAGKTTTLRVISGLMRPTAGNLLLDGHDLTGAAAEELARVGVCLIPEGRGIFPNLTVRENILMDTYGSGRKLAELEERAFDRFPAPRRPHRADGGHALGWRAADAGAGAGAQHRPGADPARRAVNGPCAPCGRRSVRSRAATGQNGVTIVVVEQFADVVLGFADQVVVITQGTVRLSGTPTEIEAQLHAAYLGTGE